ncbi:PREDICTED: RNA-binding E3 ubiquitin-protein ligase MEX3C [Sturnus vulgaris]|uniref:RNA-binding E3 ubiquitin-protein ligase MEX3C n=1 Tax=Sturnus vulgaris TaxID=9172 RepID=UPI00071A0DA2|nr:PREDICTED: RNA-binding E3 ubiquitin-protein ligase MEX3C [Sturnus vulgaris]
MPSGGAKEANEAAEPAVLLLPQRLQELGLHGKEEEEEGEAALKEHEEDEDEAAPQPPSPLLPAVAAAEGEAGARRMTATVLSRTRGGAPATSGEQAALVRRKSVNTTECVPVPTSEHVAEIVGRQGCKIKALRAKTNTYIKTPLRGKEPVFVVTGRLEDVATAKREILSAAKHFSLIRASRGRSGGPGGPCLPPVVPGQTTVHVRVPYSVVGLVVGPRGATIKRIQQQTHTYIVTPCRDREPVFEVTGMPENVDRAREEIETHIASRTGSFPRPGDGCDFRANGTDVGFEARPRARARAGVAAGYRNDSSSSLGSGSTDSCLGGGRLADFSPASPFGAGGFWFGEALPAVGAEERALDSPAYEPLPAPSPTIWAPLRGPEAVGAAGAPRRGSRSPTPRLSPTFSESLEHPLARRARGDAPGGGPQAGLPMHIPAFSNGTNSYSSSNGGSTSSSPPECRRRHDCVLCLEGEAGAALVPCGHSLFCLPCASRICDGDAPACPVCQSAVTQAIRIHC